MIILSVTAIFILLHIYFLQKNIFFDVNAEEFFYYTAIYKFDKDIAIESLFFSLACLIAFILGYLIINRKSFSILSNKNFEYVSKKEINLTSALLLIICSYITYSLIEGNFNYTKMVEIREKMGFIFELRAIPLLLLSHILLNIPRKDLLKSNELKFLIILTTAYISLLVFFQARSALFEVMAVISYTQLMWEQDKIKIKYIILFFVALIIPNLIVLGRMDLERIDGGLIQVISHIFTFEYSIVINNFLGQSIASFDNYLLGSTFIPTLLLVIPSPIRNIIGIEVVKSSYYQEICDSLNFHSGGFSMLGEFYSNFGWYSLMGFFLMGLIIGFFRNKCLLVSKVNLIYSSGPLIFTSFILTFRNDYGVFLKYIIQIIILSILFKYIFNRTK